MCSVVRAPQRRVYCARPRALSPNRKYTHIYLNPIKVFSQNQIDVMGILLVFDKLKIPNGIKLYVSSIAYICHTHISNTNIFTLKFSKHTSILKQLPYSHIVFASHTHATQRTMTYNISLSPPHPRFFCNCFVL